MRVTRDTLDQHRTAILDAASALFRGRGIDRVSIADVTRAAGLTHGAFYGHYKSKAALAEAAMVESLHRGAAHWRGRADKARQKGADPLDAIIDGYLSESHRDAVESGCALAALGPELVRAEPELRAALRAGVDELLTVLRDEIRARHPGLAQDEPHGRALAILAALSGGLTLARVFTDGDPARSRNALQAAAAAARAAADDGTLTT
jgi:TetR/AcrR family transcriptional repressor of nem operon